MKVETRQQFYELDWVVVSRCSMDGVSQVVYRAAGVLIDGNGLTRLTITNMGTGRRTVNYMIGMKFYRDEYKLFKDLGI